VRGPPPLFGPAQVSARSKPAIEKSIEYAVPDELRPELEFASPLLDLPEEDVAEPDDSLPGELDAVPLAAR
jgi:hypothetical protein